jgi:hypothetical protein
VGLDRLERLRGDEDDYECSVGTDKRLSTGSPDRVHEDRRVPREAAVRGRGDGKHLLVANDRCIGDVTTAFERATCAVVADDPVLVVRVVILFRCGYDGCRPGKASEDRLTTRELSSSSRLPLGPSRKARTEISHVRWTRS